MDWKDIAGAVGKAAPILGTLLGGPAGAVVGTIGSIISSALGCENSPAAVQMALQSNPDAAVKLAQIEADSRVRLQELAVRAASDQINAEQAATESVNATMRAEAASEHWPTYSWRPSIGFSVSFNIAMSTLLVCGVFAAQCASIDGAEKAVVALPSALGAMAAIVGLASPILGIASWFRGKMQSDAGVK